MSSNIRVQRICQHCGEEFTARTTVTRFCSDVCAKRAYKVKLREGKIKQSYDATIIIKTRPIEELNAKPILKPKEAARLLGCSVRTVYRLIDNNTIPAKNLGERLTRINASEIHKLLTDGN